jgi:signal transduction histidine kinase/ligand-binding sensor domain-containing protein/DNA-binding response OmpR family regulator
MTGRLFITLFFTLLYLFKAFNVYGQQVKAINPFPDNNFVSISVEQGLSQSTVYSILKDSKGFMWFGTRTGGLNKYDGYVFTVFKNDPNDEHSLASNTVISLFEDHRGNIWIGTRNGGLNVYDPEQDVIRRILLPDNDSPYFSTFAIFQNDPQNIWIGTSFGLYSYSFPADSIHLVLNTNVTGPISSIAALNKKLIITSIQRLLVFDVELNRLKDYNFISPQARPVASDRIIPVMVDKKDNIWVGSIEGLLTFTLDGNGNLRKNRPFANIPPELDSEIRAIAADHSGEIWFGTFMGLVNYDPAQESFTIFNTDQPSPHSLGHKSIFSLLVDETNTLWVGTWGSGVNLKSGLLRKFEYFAHQFNNPSSLSDNLVSSFAEDKDGVWVGTEQGGLNFFDKKTNTFKYLSINSIGPNPTQSNHLKALLMDIENNLWVGTLGNGLLKLNRRLNSFNHFLGDNRIFSLAQTPDRNIWVGTSAGLFKLNPEGSIIEQYTSRSDDHSQLASNMIITMVVDSKGDLWIGTSSGVYLYNAQGNNFKRFVHIPGDNRSLSSNSILSLSDGDQQNLWVGTLQGLNRLNKIDGTASRINEKFTFPDNVINGILQDQTQNLWLSTNNGLIHYLPKEETFLHYDFRDGLQSNEFNRGAHYRTINGKLYFGGINGFNSFYPSQIEKNPYIPQIQFTDLKLFYKSVSPNTPSSPLSRSITHTSEIKLTHAQSAFTIEFVALNYILPEKTQYAYYMEGYDSDWNYAGNNRTASYMNLNPGKYTFHVMASNNDGLWNEEGISLRVVVLPPFWKTPWAFVILGIILIMLLLLARSIIISRIKQQNQLEFQRREVKRIEEINNMKLRFFTDISHEFKTPLTLIKSPVDKLRKFSHLDKEFGYLTNIAYKNVNRMMRLVEQLMTFRRIEKDTLKVAVAEHDMEQIFREIVDDFSEMASNKQIRLRFHCQNINSKSQWFDKNFLDKIIFNLVSNAFKYTPKGGDINVFLTLDNKNAHIKVSDTGIGISPDKLQKIFERFYTTDNHQFISSSGTGIGLALTKSLVELHRGSIEVESIPEKGSTFRVILPVDRKSYTDNEILPQALEDTGTALPIKTSPVIPDTVPRDNQSKEKIILVVEDNEDMRNYLIFNFGEYNIISAENGKDALEITQNIIPDLIISDVMMPLMNGIEFLTQIRENHVTSHIPFILLSAKTEINDKIEGLESGADIYLEKPFDIEFLKVSVNSLLELRKNLKQLYSGTVISEPEEKAIPVLHKKFLEKASKIIIENVSDENFSVNELGDALNLSRSQLFRKFKTICDLSPGEFIRNERLNFASGLLREGELNVNEVAFQSGFSSASYFITSFKKKYGKTPNEVMKQS